ncbi:MAG: efflux RND transporter periplasmic adaptor subunit, partial [Solimonas sp.]
MDPTPTRAAAAARPTRLSRRAKIVSTLGVVIGLALLGALGWYLAHRNTSSPAAGVAGAPGGPGGPGMMMGGGGRRGGATTVGTAKAEIGSVPLLLEALGTVTPLATVTVRPQVSGVIQTVAFTEGQMVKKGELLAQIDPRPFQLALQQAQAALQRDDAELTNAKLQYERYRTLLAQDSIAQQDVDTQQATMRQLEGTVASDRAAVGTAQLDVEYSRITAPVAGRVGLRVVDAGNYIAAGDSAGIALITQIAPIDVAFTVPQDQVAGIQAAAAAGKLPATALDRTRTATLAQGSFMTLDNQVDTTTGTVRAKARFGNDDSALFPNQFVNLRLQLRMIDGAVLVPVAAARKNSQGDYVYVLNDDRTVTLRAVTLGVQNGERIEIKSGLKAGETVITEGGDRLKDGGTVQLPGDAPPTPGAGAAAGAPSGERKRRDGT